MKKLLLSATTIAIMAISAIPVFAASGSGGGGSTSGGGGSTTTTTTITSPVTTSGGSGGGSTAIQNPVNQVYIPSDTDPNTGVLNTTRIDGTKYQSTGTNVIDVPVIVSTNPLSATGYDISSNGATGQSQVDQLNAYYSNPKTRDGRIKDFNCLVNFYVLGGNGPVVNPNCLKKLF